MFKLAIVVFCYKNECLARELIEYFDHKQSVIFTHWDATSKTPSSEFKCRNAELIQVTPSESISWGGSGVLKVQERVIREALNFNFNHILFLTEDTIPVVSYRELIRVLMSNSNRSFEIASPASSPAFSLVNFLPKNSHRNKTLLARLDFKLGFLLPRLDFKDAFWRGRAWLALSRLHAENMIAQGFCFNAMERFWIHHFVLFSEEYFLQTALKKLVESGVGEVDSRRLVHANYETSNPRLLCYEDLLVAQQNRCLFARKASLALWGQSEILRHE